MWLVNTLVPCLSFGVALQNLELTIFIRVYNRYQIIEYYAVSPIERKKVRPLQLHYNQQYQVTENPV